MHRRPTPLGSRRRFGRGGDAAFLWAVIHNVETVRVVAVWGTYLRIAEDGERSAVAQGPLRETGLQGWVRRSDLHLPRGAYPVRYSELASVPKCRDVLIKEMAGGLA